MLLGKDDGHVNFARSKFIYNKMVQGVQERTRSRTQSSKLENCATTSFWFVLLAFWNQDAFDRKVEDFFEILLG